MRRSFSSRRDHGVILLCCEADSPRFLILWLPGTSFRPIKTRLLQGCMQVGKEGCAPQEKLFSRDRPLLFSMYFHFACNFDFSERVET